MCSATGGRGKKSISRFMDQVRQRTRRKLPLTTQELIEKLNPLPDLIAPSAARLIANQCASAAVKLKGSIFQLLYRRLLPRLGHKQAIWAVAHKLCRLIWMILHKGIRYEERGPAVSERSKRVRTNRMIRILRKLANLTHTKVNSGTNTFKRSRILHCY